MYIGTPTPLNSKFLIVALIIVYVLSGATPAQSKINFCAWMDCFIGGFVGRDSNCLVSDSAGNRIQGLYHQIKDGECHYILSELSSPPFTAWKMPVSVVV